MDGLNAVYEISIKITIISSTFSEKHCHVSPPGQFGVHDLSIDCRFSASRLMTPQQSALQGSWQITGSTRPATKRCSHLINRCCMTGGGWEIIPRGQKNLAGLMKNNACRKDMETTRATARYFARWTSSAWEQALQPCSLDNLQQTQIPVPSLHAPTTGWKVVKLTSVWVRSWLTSQMLEGSVAAAQNEPGLRS